MNYTEEQIQELAIESGINRLSELNAYIKGFEMAAKIYKDAKNLADAFNSFGINEEESERIVNVLAKSAKEGEEVVNRLRDVIIKENLKESSFTTDELNKNFPKEKIKQEKKFWTLGEAKDEHIGKIGTKKRVINTQFLELTKKKHCKKYKDKDLFILNKEKKISNMYYNKAIPEYNALDEYYTCVDDFVFCKSTINKLRKQLNKDGYKLVTQV